MTVVEYARVSTDHQSLEAQQDALHQAGAERIFTDKLSGVREDRTGLASLVDYVRAGDTVVVVAPDRLGGPALLIRGGSVGGRGQQRVQA